MIVSDLSSNTVPPNPVIQNWIGPFGAIVSKGLFFFFGAAAYLVPTICLGFGLAHFIPFLMYLIRSWRAQELPWDSCFQ